MRELKFERKPLTVSAMNTFCECRQKYHYRYERGIAPTAPQMSLEFGSAIHAGLEFWFKVGSLEAALDAFAYEAQARSFTDEDTIKGMAMLKRYAEVYAHEDFEAVKVEHLFRTELKNPKTGRKSKRFVQSGKIDGLVKDCEGSYWILEHKTRKAISEDEIKAIPMNAQLGIYVLAIEQELDIKIKGAIFDILVKPGISMKVGETEEEFLERRAKLIAKSKTGTSSAQRQMPETLEEFRDRCLEKLTDDCFRREYITFDTYSRLQFASMAWAIAQDMRGYRVYRNTGACCKGGMACPHIDLCRADGDLSLVGDLYINRTINEELR